MKKTSIVILAGAMQALVAGGLWAGTAADPTPEISPVPASIDKIPEGLTGADWAGIRAAHEAERHAVVRREDGTLAAPNPGQRWSTRFDGRGFTVTPGAGGWSWGLELRSYGFSGAERQLGGQAAVSHDGGRVAYDWDASLREWFVNDRRGLQQGWTLGERPAGAEDGGPLRLEFAVRGGLKPEVAANGSGAVFLDAAGARVLDFSGLQAWDADGQALAARFETAEIGGDTLALQVAVEECGARYPLTIDPIAQQAYLKASNTDEGDRFGHAVAVSGDTVVVSAIFEESNATGVNGDGSDNSAEFAGAAYVFARFGNNWIQQAYLKGSHTDVGDAFGHSVAVSGDTVVVGAIGEDGSSAGVNGDQSDNNAFNSGAAYVFTRSGNTWSQQAYLKASNIDVNDYFGTSVAVSGDTVVVGSPHESSNATGVNGDQDNNNAQGAGAAYVFTRNGSTWIQQAYLKASNTGALDLFGYSVAISGDTVVVGADFEDSSATGIGGVESDNSASESGAAYVFLRSGTGWRQQAYLKASNTGADDRFGASVSVSGDTVVVGAEFEDSGATGIGGVESDNSASASGAAYVFTRSFSTWSQQAYLKASNTDAGDGFGNTVSVSGDTVVVGAYAEDSSSTGANGDEDDNSAMLAGAAYVFTRSGSTWSQHAYLKASNTDAGDHFGEAVAVSDDTVIVSAPSEYSNATGVNGNQLDNNASNSGAAYMFSVPPSQAEIVVKESSGLEIQDGWTNSFGGAPPGEGSSRTFTIRNISDAGDLTGVSISKDGPQAADYTVTSSPAASVTPGGSTSFTVGFAPADTGIRTAVIHIASNDSNENPFDIVLRGRGLQAGDDTDGDGMDDVTEFKLAPLGFDWMIADTNLAGILQTAGFYSEDDIRNVYVDAPLIEVIDGAVTLDLQLKKSDDLINWNNFGDPAQWTEPAGDKSFYRLFFSEP